MVKEERERLRAITVWWYCSGGSRERNAWIVSARLYCCAFKSMHHYLVNRVKSQRHFGDCGKAPKRETMSHYTLVAIAEGPSHRQAFCLLHATCPMWFPELHDESLNSPTNHQGSNGTVVLLRKPQITGGHPRIPFIIVQTMFVTTWQLVDTTTKRREWTVRWDLPSKRALPPSASPSQRTQRRCRGESAPDLMVIWIQSTYILLCVPYRSPRFSVYASSESFRTILLAYSITIKINYGDRESMIPTTILFLLDDDIGYGWIHRM